MTRPQRMDLRKIAKAGAARDKALAVAEAELVAIVDEVIDAGELGRVALAAELANVTRKTLYRRIKVRRLERERQATR